MAAPGANSSKTNTERPQGEPALRPFPACNRKAMMTKILLLEDESSLLALMRRMLEPYNLIEATTAEQALRLFYQNGRQVDLLVADVTLPTSSGIQVALILRQEIPELPVILTSGYPVDTWGDRDSADLDKLGSKSVAILAKPFQSQLLLNAVRELTATSFQSAGAE